MVQKLSVPLLRIFFGVFALAFGWLWLVSAFANKLYPHGTLAAALLAVVLGGLYLLAYVAIHRFDLFFKRWGYALCGAVAVFTLVVLLVNGFAMRYDPAYDLEAIYGGGLTWAESGTMVGNERYMQYFHMFPDNLGGAFLFRLVFGCSQALGISDSFAVALVFNSLLIAACIPLVYDYLRLAFGWRTAAFSLVAFISFIPLYMMGAVFYTDLLTILFPVLGLALYQRGRQVEGTRKYIYFGGAGLALGFGAMVKITVAIMAVAILIASLLTPPRRLKKGHYKTQLLAMASLGCSLLLVLGGFRLFVRSSQLDPQRLEKEAMPFSHWVAMGLIGDGGYDENDYDRAMKLPSKAARIETNRQLIARRLLEPSAADLAKLFTRKGLRCFGDGTYDLAIFLDDGPHQRAPQHEWVLRDGQHYRLYSQLSQGLYLALLGLAVLAAARAALFVKKGWRLYRHPAPWLAFFGLMLFLMMWETNSRYTLNYLPILIIMASAGAATALPARWLAPKR